jgi:hypothetical protein
MDGIFKTTAMKKPPDIKYDDRKDNSLRPSWTDNMDFIDEGHRAIFNLTKDIPGWQMEGDTYKLYEMGYYSGNSILEIGTFGGRSAVAEIFGALKAFPQPQFFGIDVDAGSIERTYDTLCRFGLAEYALLYHGSLQSFMKELSIQPTMCFVDGDHRYDGVKRDLDSLSEMLCPGIPVFCHDYTNPENETGEYGVRKAVSEWEAEEYVTFYGVFGCAALFVTTAKCKGRKAVLSAEEFAERRAGLLDTYGLGPRTSPSKRSRLKKFVRKILGSKR